MAQTGYTPIYLYYSGTATHIPLAASLGNGELAINAADGNLFYKNTSNAVVTVPLLQSSASQNGWLSPTDWTTFNNKAPGITFTSTHVPFGQGTTTLNQSENLTFNNTNSIFSVYGDITTPVGVGLRNDNAGTSGGTKLEFGNYRGTITAYLSNQFDGGSFNTRLWQQAVGYIAFGTNNAENVRIHNGGGVSIGNTTNPGAANLSVTGTVKTLVTTVASLPSAATVGAGARAFVTNALAPVFGSAVVGGGGVNVPVYSTGSAWFVG